MAKTAKPTKPGPAVVAALLALVGAVACDPKPVVSATANAATTSDATAAVEGDASTRDDRVTSVARAIESGTGAESARLLEGLDAETLRAVSTSAAGCRSAAFALLELERRGTPARWPQKQGSGAIGDVARALCVLTNDRDAKRWNGAWKEFLPPDGAVALEREICQRDGTKRRKTSSVTRTTATGDEIGPLFNPFRCHDVTPTDAVCEAESWTGQLYVVSFSVQNGEPFIRRIQRTELTGCAS